MKEAKARLGDRHQAGSRCAGRLGLHQPGFPYYQVPGWPVGFGDDEKAEQLLKQALAINPTGIDPNFFYGDFLLDQGTRRRRGSTWTRPGRPRQTGPRGGGRGPQGGDPRAPRQAVNASRSVRYLNSAHQLAYWWAVSFEEKRMRILLVEDDVMLGTAWWMPCAAAATRWTGCSRGCPALSALKSEGVRRPHP